MSNFLFVNNEVVFARVLAFLLLSRRICINLKSGMCWRRSMIHLCSLLDILSSRSYFFHTWEMIRRESPKMTTFFIPTDTKRLIPRYRAYHYFLLLVVFPRPHSYVNIVCSLGSRMILSHMSPLNLSTCWNILNPLIT